MTFTLDRGAAVSAARKSLGDDYPMQIEEPRSYKTATGEPVQDEGFRVVPIVTEEGLHRCINFRVAPVHKALVSASKVCHKGNRIILDSEPGQSGMLHKYTNEWIGLREEKCVYVFDGWISPATTAGRKRSKVLSLTPYEHSVDVAPVDFPRMNPDDTVPASEEVGGEGEEAIPAKGLPSPTQPTRKEIQEHVLTHLPPRSWCGHCLRGGEQAFRIFAVRLRGSMLCRLCQLITSSWVHLDKRKHKVCSRCWQ